MRAKRRSPIWIVLAIVVIAVGASTFLLRSKSYAAVRPADPAKAGPRLRAAIDDYVARADSNSGSAEAHGDLGLLYAENGFYHEAVTCFEHAEALDSENLAWPFRRALALRQTGDDKAATAVIESLANDPRVFPAVYYELGRARAHDGDLSGAQAAFSKAVDMAPKRAEPLVALADVLNRQNRFEKARELSQLALQQDGDYTAAHYQLGLALRGVGKRDDAKRELQLGLGAEQRSLPDPASRRASELGISRGGRVARGVALCESGDLSGAVAMFRSLAEEYPEDIPVLNNYAAVLIQMKRHDDAMKILNDIVRIDDRVFGPYINLSFCSLQLGRFADAITFARQAVEHGSHVAQTHVALGDALSVAGKSEDALAAYARAQQLDPNNSRVSLVMGRLCQKMGKKAEALRHFQEAVKREPDSFMAHIGLCSSALETGAFDLAARALARADTLGPDHPSTIELRKKLQLAQGR